MQLGNLLSPCMQLIAKQLKWKLSDCPALVPCSFGARVHKLSPSMLNSSLVRISSHEHTILQARAVPGVNLTPEHPAERTGSKVDGAQLAACSLLMVSLLIFTLAALSSPAVSYCCGRDPIFCVKLPRKLYGGDFNGDRVCLWTASTEVCISSRSLWPFGLAAYRRGRRLLSSS
jgi:hypothetical protein